VGEVGEGCFKAAGFYFERGEAVGQGASLTDGGANVFGEIVQSIREAGLARSKSGITFEGLAHEFDSSQLLAETIVEILPDAALFALADFEDLLLQLEKTLIFFELFERAPDDLGDELKEIDVFNEVIERAALHHFNGDAFVTLTRDDNERSGTLNAGELIDEVGTLDVMQFEVEQHEVGVILPEPGNGFIAREGGGDGESFALKGLLNEAREALVVVNDKNRCGLYCGHRRT
jgi:hypothetical protein